MFTTHATALLYYMTTVLTILYTKRLNLRLHTHTHTHEHTRKCTRMHRHHTHTHTPHAPPLHSFSVGGGCDMRNPALTIDTTALHDYCPS